MMWSWPERQPVKRVVAVTKIALCQDVGGAERQSGRCSPGLLPRDEQAGWMDAKRWPGHHGLQVLLPVYSISL